MAMTTANTSLLTRAEVWSSELKEVLEEDLMGMKYVKMLSDFPDGDTFKIASIGTARADDYQEDTEVQFRPMDTGQFTFTVDEYLSSGNYITKKAEQDSFLVNQMVSTFVPQQRRAILEHFETNLFERPEAVYSANAQGQINEAYHRMSGGNSGRIELQDFAYAWYALDKANVPTNGRIAIVDPVVGFDLNTLSSLVSVSDNPRWEGIVESGMTTGMTFIKNIYGFDVYTSNFLPTITDSALPDRAGGNAVDYSSTNGKACYFFSSDSTVLPLVAAWRQEPTVDTIWRPERQRTEFLTTARYGAKLYRPENMVMVSTLTSVS